MTEHEETIVKAAANILREAGIERVTSATSLDERKCANSALLASITITEYLEAARNVDLPFS